MNTRALGALTGACLFVLPASASADFPHVVAAGETLSSVAAQDGLTVASLAAANGLSANAELISGTILHIPPQGTQGSASSSAAPTTTATTGSTGSTGSDGLGGGSYLVRFGDTLSGIAARAGTTVAALAAASGLNPNEVLLAGATLTLPGGSSGSDGVSTGDSAGGAYVVRFGDTLSGIAVQAATTVASLAAANGLNPDGVLLAGTMLTVPGGSQTSYIEHVSTRVSSTTATTRGNTAGPYPTNQYMSASQIAAIAESEGVPASLAKAIGWQESGWSNAVVSPAGAVGVMQIVPSTWRWIAANLATVPLAPASATDNVRAGVLLLRALLAQTGSDGQAAAGYYQGLASISQSGELPSTRQYVADVIALQSHFGG